jgi:hypothetical protein
MVAEENVVLLRALRITLRVLLLLACAFWALISLEILPPLFLDGLDAARQKLAHIWSRQAEARPFRKLSGLSAITARRLYRSDRFPSSCLGSAGDQAFSGSAAGRNVGDKA